MIILRARSCEAYRRRDLQRQHVHPPGYPSLDRSRSRNLRVVVFAPSLGYIQKLMGRTTEVSIIAVTLCVVVIAAVRGLHFVLPMRIGGDAEMNARTHDVRCLPLRATTRARSSRSIVHAGVFVFINDMGELAFKYLRSSLHYIRVLFQRRAGLGYGGTLILHSSTVNLSVQYFWPRFR